jgi:phosphonate transport system ATP-binding protein
MIHIRGLRKTFPPNTVALDGVDLEVSPGEFVMVIGQSGAGKSTLLRCVNRLIEPTAGEVALNGSRVTGANAEALRTVRRQMGMIFQQFNLVKRASVMENVLAGRLGHVPGVPSLFGRFPRKDRDLAIACLRLVGLEEFAERRADRLSGGEQQRVAIARALAQEPKVILADEPTASLDPMLTESIMSILQRINRERGLTLVVSQHMLETALSYGTRIVGLRQGRVIFDGPPSALTPETVEAIYQGGTR